MTQEFFLFLFLFLVLVNVFAFVFVFFLWGFCVCLTILMVIYLKFTYLLSFSLKTAWSDYLFFVFFQINFTSVNFGD